VANHAPAHLDHVAPHAEHSGPSVRTYVNIFVVLFVMTAIEVGASYLTDFGVPEWGEILVLVALAAMKGLLVVMFYMHLRFDSRWFTMLFAAAMVLATGCVIAFLTLFAYHRGIVG
jgi:cytochrome c oxidase subunit 4